MSVTSSANTPLLITNAAGTAANTNGDAVPYQNPDPLFLSKSLYTTVYMWADEWAGAEVQLYISPHRKGGPVPPVWFPVSDAQISNAVASIIGCHWHQIKAEVQNATAQTAGLNVRLFDGHP